MTVAYRLLITNTWRLCSVWRAHLPHRLWFSDFRHLESREFDVLDICSGRRLDSNQNDLLWLEL